MRKPKPKLEHKLKFYHFRSNQGNGSVSVGYYVDLEGKIVYYTFARCNKKDNFCRRIGREICVGRMLKHGPSSLNFQKYEDIKDYFVKTFHPDHVNMELVTSEEAHAAKGYGDSAAKKEPRRGLTQDSEPDLGDLNIVC